MKYTLLTIAILLTGCASSYHGTVPNSGSTYGGKPPKYAPPPPPSNYGEWYIDTTTCSIRARASDFSLVNDGKPYKGTITVKALFIAPQAMSPRVEVSEILAPVPVEGANRGYNIILAYDAMNAAHMMKPDTYLMVRYQPLNSAQVLESSFATRGLMFALADLAKFCE
jgi:hypothetical protein